MIRTKFLTITITVLFSLMGCKSNKKNDQSQFYEKPILSSKIERVEETETAALSDEDYIIKGENTNIKLGEKYENLITNDKLEKVSNISESKAYTTYVYENFIIEVGDTIFVIKVLTPTLKTSRGISIGNSLSNIFETYGLIAETSNNVYEYSHKGKILEFHIDKNNKVENIILWIDG